MAFYLRKALSVGPLRFNLSKSGVGLSAGIKGLRVGKGVRGAYIHAGRNGLYLRRSLGSGSDNGGVEIPESEVTTNSNELEMNSIDSGETTQIIDKYSIGLVEEIKENKSRPRKWPWVFFIQFLIYGLLFLANPIIGGTLFIVMLISTILVAEKDRQKRITPVIFSVDDDIYNVYEKFFESFEGLKTSQKVWSVESEGLIEDRRGNSGATTRTAVLPVQLSVGEPTFIKTNVPVPCMPAGRQKLYFLPTCILVVEGEKIGAVSYSMLRLEYRTSHNVEKGMVPTDAEKVGSTWQYVNNDGSPDKRRGYNPELPIMLYAEIDMESETGLRERFTVSSIEKAEKFFVELENLKECYKDVTAL